MSLLIAEQTAFDKEGTEFTFRIYKPEKSESDMSDWHCKYSICTTSTNIDHHMHGVSSLQALSFALNIVSVRAEIFGINLSLS